MYSDLHSNKVPMNQGLQDRLNFSVRADLTELMDGPSSYEDLRACFHDLAQVNQLTFAYRPTMRWLQQFLERGRHPLHIVDVGSGGGDMLRHIERWASKRGLSVRLTGVDLNPSAIRAAREFTSPNSRIQWIVGDVYSLDHISDPIDLVISSLFTHHLTDQQIVQFLKWMERVARCGWFINDLSRGRLSYVAFQILAKVAAWHSFIQHDGPVSIRRAFHPEDWKSYAKSAVLPMELIQIEKCWPGRLTVSRSKQS